MYKAKQKFKRILSAFATMALLVCVLSTYTIGGVFAATNDGLEYVKSIKPDPDVDDKYSLSLTVSDVADKTSNKVDVVLVMDTSGSMNNDMNGSSRIDIAKNAVAGNGGFVDIMSGNDNLDVNIAMVSFDTDVEVVTGWMNISGDYKSNVPTVKNKIESAVAEGATLTQGGIRTANELLKNSRSDAKQIFVLVTDGQPTLCYAKKDVDVVVEASYVPGNTACSYYSYPSDRINEYNNDVLVANGYTSIYYPDAGKRHSLNINGVKRTWGTDDYVIGRGEGTGYVVGFSKGTNVNCVESIVKDVDGKNWTTPGNFATKDDLLDYCANPDTFEYLIPRDKDGNFIGGLVSDVAITDPNFHINRALEETEKLTAVDGFYSLSVADPTMEPVLHQFAEAVPLKKDGVSDVVAANDSTSFTNYFKDLAKKIDQQVVYGIKINDTLSEYVDLAEKPNYRARITDDSGNAQTVSPSDSKYPFDGVAYDSQKRTVSAEFKKGYNLETNYTYELLFDVVVNAKAYKDYFENIQNDPNDGYGGTTGNTGSGDSSEGKPGFYSNTKGDVTVTYGYENPTPVTKEYEEKPVAQIGSPKTMTIKKVWGENTLGKKTEVKATLTGECTDSDKTQTELDALKISKQVTLNAGNNWEVEVKGLPSKHYKFSVAEDTKLKGFLDADIKIDDSADPRLVCTIINDMPSFVINDGETADIDNGGKIYINTLAFDKKTGEDKMTPDLKRMINENKELKGKVTYQWYDPNGKPVGDPTTADITDTSRDLPEIPTYEFTGVWKGTDTENKFTLKATFENADGADPLSDTGIVTVNVKHIVVPTGIKENIVPGLLAISFMTVATLLARMFVKRKERSVR